MLPPRHASPGLNTCGSRPSVTFCPNDCAMPPGPFGATVMSRLSGAVGSSFWPEKTQMDLACSGPAVGLPFPLTSPANAALPPSPIGTPPLFGSRSYEQSGFAGMIYMVQICKEHDPDPRRSTPLPRPPGSVPIGERPRR